MCARADGRVCAFQGLQSIRIRNRNDMKSKLKPTMITSVDRSLVGRRLQPHDYYYDSPAQHLICAFDQIPFSRLIQSKYFHLVSYNSYNETNKQQQQQKNACILTESMNFQSDSFRSRLSLNLMPRFFFHCKSHLLLTHTFITPLLLYKLPSIPIRLITVNFFFVIFGFIICQPTYPLN